MFLPRSPAPKKRQLPQKWQIEGWRRRCHQVYSKKRHLGVICNRNEIGPKRTFFQKLSRKACLGRVPSVLCRKKARKCNSWVLFNTKINLKEKLARPRYAFRSKLLNVNELTNGGKGHLRYFSRPVLLKLQTYIHVRKGDHKIYP